MRVAIKRWLWGLGVMVAVTSAGCSTSPVQPQASAPGESTGAVAVAPQFNPSVDSGSPAKPPSDVVKLGTGEFVQQPPQPKSWSDTGRGTLTLNFENTDIRDVVKVVMRDILRRNYSIDPNIKGRVTLSTSRPLAADALLDVLESVLQMNAAALVEVEGVYKIVPIANAMKDYAPLAVGSNLPSTVSGFNIQVVPLKYVDAEEMLKIIEPFVAAGATARADKMRNLMVLAAPRNNLQQLLETVRIFDVDYMKGLSMGLFRLQYTDAKTLIPELDKLFGIDSARESGVIRFQPIERLNAVLALSKNPSYIREAERLIDKLDLGSDSAGRRLHVYALQNAKAEVIAGVLQDLFKAGNASASAPSLLSAAQSGASPAEAPTATKAVATSTQSPAATPVSASRKPATGDESVNDVTIIADKANNAILVMGSLDDYRTVESAIQKLDVPPRQVLIEATIAEVTLTDGLQYGLQWFLQGRQSGYRTTGGLSSTESSTLPSAVVPGFSFAVSNSLNEVRALFDALANESKLKVLSSPSVMVIDNQSANIRVGDQIPIITRQTSGVGNADSPIVNEVQFRDTGVLLQVTPRINSGGLVTLEINQEVSEPSADEFAAGNVSILQRSIQSSVAVQSGETVVLGGLIRESDTDTETGVPLLKDIPLLGFFFSRTVRTKQRTELVVTITPRVIEDSRQARIVTQELRDRLDNVTEWLKEVKY